MVMGLQTPFEDVEPTVSVEAGLGKPDICIMRPQANQARNRGNRTTIQLFGRYFLRANFRMSAG
jgi:hypothetical protein